MSFWVNYSEISCGQPDSSFQTIKYKMRYMKQLIIIKTLTKSIKWHRYYHSLIIIYIYASRSKRHFFRLSSSKTKEELEGTWEVVRDVRYSCKHRNIRYQEYKTCPRRPGG